MNPRRGNLKASLPDHLDLRNTASHTILRLYIISSRGHMSPSSSSSSSSDTSVDAVLDSVVSSVPVVEVVPACGSSKPIPAGTNSSGLQANQKREANKHWFSARPWDGAAGMGQVPLVSIMDHGVQNPFNVTSSRNHRNRRWSRRQQDPCSVRSQRHRWRASRFVALPVVQGAPTG